MTDLPDAERAYALSGIKSMLDLRANKVRELAEQAEGSSARRGIEFLPWANIKAVHDGLRVVEAAGHPLCPDVDLHGAGVCWDVAPTEVSDSPEMARLRAEYEKGRAAQRWYR
jgi:hypothetical protein